jgi:hypothetical protein
MIRADLLCVHDAEKLENKIFCYKFRALEMPDPRYMNVASREYERYKKWIADDVVPALPFHPDISAIVIGYIMLTEKRHFEAVICVRPRILDWVWQFNEMLNRGGSYRGGYGCWTFNMQINDELLPWFNNYIKEMNKHSVELPYVKNYNRYREVSIVDQYIKNSHTITHPAWPIGESDLRMKKGRILMVHRRYS